ncbi:MAG: hypothetical protein SFY32_13490, partial [Bacteroidota bacterium]|nr:hypothetical protein [Bacteroidota bacterium]
SYLCSKRKLRHNTFVAEIENGLCSLHVETLCWCATSPFQHSATTEPLAASIPTDHYDINNGQIFTKYKQVC